jgi:hypothetical protein
MSFHIDKARFQEALEFFESGDVESAHDALLRCCDACDHSLLQQFRDRNCDVSAEEIEDFSELECWSLSRAISRQLYWDEPPLFSVDDVLVDIPATPFKFAEQIKSLVRRLTLLCDL